MASPPVSGTGIQVGPIPARITEKEWFESNKGLRV